MLKCALALCGKDLKLTFSRGAGLMQALLLGLLLVFLFSLSLNAGDKLSPQAAAAMFWLASAFCQVLIFNMLYAVEETAQARLGLLLLPSPPPGMAWQGLGRTPSACRGPVHFRARSLCLSRTASRHGMADGDPRYSSRRCRHGGFRLSARSFVRRQRRQGIPAVHRALSPARSHASCRGSPRIHGYRCGTGTGRGRALARPCRRLRRTVPRLRASSFPLRLQRR